MVCSLFLSDAGQREAEFAVVPREGELLLIDNGGTQVLYVVGTVLHAGGKISIGARRTTAMTLVHGMAVRSQDTGEPPCETR